MTVKVLAGNSHPFLDRKHCIISALKATNGNKARAARLLGIPRTSVICKMEKHNIKLDDIIPAAASRRFLPSTNSEV
ncbi:MAG: hypothetical protein E3J72_22560 [Planctomycetota bacterium]|nr:MAG: hypothetical protein E3J72_22560 [Planctomycetota bacterium]